MKKEKGKGKMERGGVKERREGRVKENDKKETLTDFFWKEKGPRIETWE